MEVLALQSRGGGNFFCAGLTLPVNPDIRVGKQPLANDTDTVVVVVEYPFGAVGITDVHLATCHTPKHIAKVVLDAAAMIAFVYNRHTLWEIVVYCRMPLVSSVNVHRHVCCCKSS